MKRLLSSTLALLGLVLLMIAAPMVAGGNGYLVYLPLVMQDYLAGHESVGLALIADGFAAPTGLAESPDGSGRLFVVDRVGLIWIISSDGRVLQEPFLDLRSRMVQLNTAYDERGLLGLAFHPQYATNGRFFVYYSAPLRSTGPAGWNHTSHVSEFSVSEVEPTLANPESERILVEIDQPQSNHNGGQLAIGPDGYLYIALGDGGAANDVGTGHPDIGNGQDVTTLLGTILRIDADSGDPYEIPSDNPFVGKDGRDEIFAYGFRNPFRLSFDRGGDRELFVGEVGQNRWEEVSIVGKGGNYGWNFKEGTHCFDPKAPDTPPADCPDTGPSGEPLIDPIIEYANSRSPSGGIGQAVIGGFIYRGSALAAFRGRYVFGDWSTDFGVPDGTLLMASRPASGQALWSTTEIRVVTSESKRLDAYLLSFGEDEDGEIYVMTSDVLGPVGDTGKVFKLVPPSARLTPSITVTNQTLTDHTVTVDSVVSEGPGWIVIHANLGGAPGLVIGHAEVSRGKNTEVAVEIDLASATQTLYAMLHVDAGVIGTYEFPGPDTPVTLNGQSVTRSFKLQVAQGDVQISMTDFAFNPREMVVLSGTEVTWVNNGNVIHTSTSDTGVWDSGLLGQGETFSFTFSQLGVYPYYCTLHGAPGGVAMAGKVFVIPGEDE